jgi:hypothetical protein
MSTAKVNTLTGTTTAGSISVTGEGNSTTTNLQQGLCKAWSNLDGDASTPASRDSFNIGSVTDTAAGNYTNNFTSNMSNDDFSASTDSQDATTRTNVHSSFESQTTGGIQITHFEGGSGTDTNRVGTIVIGDLA